MRAVIALAALWLVLVLTIATMVAGRRKRPPADPACWKREPDEPWGSIILSLFFLWPVVRFIAQAVGWKALTPLAMACIGGLEVWWTGAITGARRLTVGETDIEVRSGLGRELILMSDVMSVTNVLDESMPPELHLADGRSIMLPGDDHGRALASLVAARTGQRWGVR